MNKNFDFLMIYPTNVYLEWMMEQDKSVIAMNSDMWNRLHLSVVREVYEERKKIMEECGLEIESFESFQLVSYVAHAYHAMLDSIVKQEIAEMTAVGE